VSVFTNPASASKAQAAEYIAAVLGLLGDRDPFQVLHATPGALVDVVDALPAEVLARPEHEGRWSIRHLAQHLADSELVWGWRVRLVLAHDRPALTGYDQDRWADRLHYERADAARATREFAMLRAANLRLLEAAAPGDLDRVGVHAERGEESLTHMVRLYAGHDLLHLNQLERIRQVVTRRG
jgi:uncharacterized damage-inducible protein DinB